VKTVEESVFTNFNYANKLQNKLISLS